MVRRRSPLTWALTSDTRSRRHGPSNTHSSTSKLPNSASSARIPGKTQRRSLNHGSPPAHSRISPDSRQRVSSSPTFPSDGRPSRSKGPSMKPPQTRMPRGSMLGADPSTVCLVLAPGAWATPVAGGSPSAGLPSIRRRRISSGLTTFAGPSPMTSARDSGHRVARTHTQPARAASLRSESYAPFGHPDATVTAKRPSEGTHFLATSQPRHAAGRSHRDRPARTRLRQPWVPSQRLWGDSPALRHKAMDRLSPRVPWPAPDAAHGTGPVYRAVLPRRGHRASGWPPALCGVPASRLQPADRDLLRASSERAGRRRNRRSASRRAPR